MQLYPAIDLKNGKCVRLTQGAFDQVKIYDNNPADIARKWEQQGASYLHLVDLDGALAGHSVNADVIKDIISSVSIPVQIGGGIRTAEAIEQMLNLGVSRVIIGTKAVKSPAFIETVINQFGDDKIVVGVDAKNGLVAIDGWETVSEITALDLCLQMKAYGVKHIVYTDISKDGMLTGPNIAHTSLLTEQTGIDIIASGGVSSMDDLDALSKAGISGAIIGKALYENRFTLADAIQAFQGEK